MRMEVFEGIERFEPPPRGVALTIGNFDGLHLGHQRLLLVASQRRGAGQPIVAMTFEPHPVSILAPERAPQRLTTHAEKLALLERAGADAVIVLHSEPNLLQMSAEDFCRSVVARCRPRLVVEGPTFRFGHNRQGTPETLARELAGAGCEVVVLEQERCEVEEGRVPVSSSAIRDALSAGRVERAAAMLGRPHRITGVVAAGDGRGALLGFPTANLDEIAQLVPGHGVYGAVAQLADGRLIPAAVNVGPQPTFNQAQTRVEAHLIGFDEDLRGQRMGLHLVSWLRGQIRFTGPDALVEQLRQDVAAARAAAEGGRPSHPIPL